MNNPNPILKKMSAIACLSFTAIALASFIANYVDDVNRSIGALSLIEPLTRPLWLYLPEAPICLAFAGIFGVIWLALSVKAAH
jgi:hypothetical protein